MQPGMQQPAMPAMNPLGAMGISRVPSVDNSGQVGGGGVWPMNRTSSVISEFGRTASDPAAAAYMAMRTQMAGDANQWGGGGAGGPAHQQAQQ
eukprot:1107855-Rhodomonas_salina.1